MVTESKARVRHIKRYGNRKLYDVEASRYVTLDGIRALVQSGEDVRVVDNDTGEDLTRVTFAQIIYEAEKKTNGGSGTLSLPLLRRLVQFGDEAVRDFRRGVERGREALESVREAAEQRVQQLVGTGKGRKGRKRQSSLVDDLWKAPQRTLDEVQSRLANHPALRKEIHRVEESLRQIEARLGRIAQSGRPKPTRSKRAKK